ncbi:leucine aminopeptidase 1 [Aulographum hederae CBS 113979]|uniref:Peptide hydrolase n=1 Tax=Aulographum hederae CBS 113979 TaxID=1176131 RepID=A0A6G1H2W7_9PEZI|nr:leucine aminopeptidase 1 [Aulographum hederae CBS 113979]
MKLTAVLPFCAAASAAILPLYKTNIQQVLSSDSSVSGAPVGPEGLRLVETAPGETAWISEEQISQLRRSGKKFMDITDYQALGAVLKSTNRPSVSFPRTVLHKEKVNSLLPKLDEANVRKNLEGFIAFPNRYYNSDNGKRSSEWLQKLIKDTITASGAKNATVEPFPHSWPQSSIVATIPGKSSKTVVIGAHQDSINQFLPFLSAPGADDDGSGTMTILEALKVLLSDAEIAAGNAENTIEFHWYAAEEGGLLGSQDIFTKYERDGRDITAMLQQDMTGYVKGTLDAGKEESVGVITDFVDVGLSNFIMMVVDEYCSIPYVKTECGYACSDHASASKAGYPSSFVIEAAMELTSSVIHTGGDTIDTLSFKHIMEHAKMTVGFAYELAFNKFA